VKTTLLPACVPLAPPHVPSSRRLLRLAWLTVTVHEPVALPVLRSRTDATYPCSQLAPTLTVTAKSALGARVVLVAVGFGVVALSGQCDDVGDGEWLVAVGRVEERNGDRAGDAEDGVAEVAGGRAAAPEAVSDGDSGTCGIDGSATVGCRAASAGPTARTAIQITSMTRTAAAALRKIRAGPSGRAVCFAGKRGHPFDDLGPAGNVPDQDMPLIRLPRARVISRWASRVARSCRLS
jgi:hypothetical protein